VTIDVSKLPHQAQSSIDPIHPTIVTAAGGEHGEIAIQHRASSRYRVQIRCVGEERYIGSALNDDVVVRDAPADLPRERFE